jgi:hypothetical protein
MAHQQTIWNRTEMHSEIRGATELMQQEIGQAGRITASATLLQNINAVGGAAPAAQSACDDGTPTVNAQTVQISGTSNFFAHSDLNGVLITTLDGDRRETVRAATITAGSPATLSACFLNQHDSGTVITALGAFGNGIIPPFEAHDARYPCAAPNTSACQSSDKNHLKMFGDMNDDGKILYVEYWCDQTGGKLYRLTADWTTGSKPGWDDTMILLTNITANPPDSGGVVRDCFQYQTSPPKTVQGASWYFVTDVAVTLTIQTQQIDPITRQIQLEKKALLNVSPRNVFGVWNLVNEGYTDHLQTTPLTILGLTAN